MRRSITILVSSMLALGSISPVALAQDASAGDHPIVGAWIIDPTPDDPNDIVEVFSASPDGTVTEVAPDGAGLGSWVATSEDSADATFIVIGTDADGNPTVGTIRTSVIVAEDGRSFSGVYTVEVPAAFMESMGLEPGELGPADVVGQRIDVEPMGEPVGPWPLPEPDAEDQPE